MNAEDHEMPTAQASPVARFAWIIGLVSFGVCVVIGFSVGFVRRYGVVGLRLVGRGVLAEQLANEFLDHDGSKRSRMRQPFVTAWARSVASGLVATGSVTFSSSGMSLCESL